MESARSFHQLPFYVRIKNFRKEIDKQLDPKSKLNTIDLAKDIDLKRYFLLRQSEIKKKEENIKNQKILNDDYNMPYYNIGNKLDSNTSRFIDLNLVNITKSAIDIGTNGVLASKRSRLFEDSEISSHDNSKSILKFPQLHESRNIRKNLFKDHYNSQNNLSVSKLTPIINIQKLHHMNPIIEKLKIKRNEKTKIISPIKSPISRFNSQEKSRFPELSESKNELPSFFSKNRKQFKKSQKIIKIFEFDALNGDKIKSLESFEKKKSNLIEIIDIIDNTIKYDFIKKEVDGMISKIIQIANSIECRTFYCYLMQSHGKIMFLCKEYSRAVFIFKSLNKINENNFPNKLKAYKNIARCYHDARNYQMSIFYTIKMLQCSWRCKSRKFELQAYDFLGMNYYYLGKLKLANYYHEKMMHSKLEANESEIRAIGIEKMSNKIRELQSESKKVKVVNINSANLPSSEDEFVLSISNDLAYNEDINNDYSNMKKPSNKKASEINLSNKHKRSQSNIKQNEYRLVRLTKRFTNQIPPNDEVLITHRSCLRFIESYDHIDDDMNSEMIIKADKVKNKLLKLKLIIKSAINLYENYALNSSLNKIHFILES